MSELQDQSELDAYRADSYMHDICDMQNEIDNLKTELNKLMGEIKDHKEIRRMLDTELAKSNKKLEEFQGRYKVWIKTL